MAALLLCRCVTGSSSLMLQRLNKGLAPNSGPVSAESLMTSADSYQMLLPAAGLLLPATEIKTPLGQCDVAPFRLQLI